MDGQDRGLSRWVSYWCRVCCEGMCASLKPSSGTCPRCWPVSRDVARTSIYLPSRSYIPGACSCCKGGTRILLIESAVPSPTFWAVHPCGQGVYCTCWLYGEGGASCMFACGCGLVFACVDSEEDSLCFFLYFCLSPGLVLACRGDDCLAACCLAAADTGEGPNLTSKR